MFKVGTATYDIIYDVISDETSNFFERFITLSELDLKRIFFRVGDYDYHEMDSYDHVTCGRFYNDKEYLKDLPKYMRMIFFFRKSNHSVIKFYRDLVVNNRRFIFQYYERQCGSTTLSPMKIYDMIMLFEWLYTKCINNKKLENPKISYIDLLNIETVTNLNLDDLVRSFFTCDSTNRIILIYDYISFRNSILKSVT